MIHKTAFIDSEANIGKNVTVGPFCSIGPNVTIHDGVELSSHVVIEKNTILNKNVKVGPFSVLGGDPQSIGFKNHETFLEVGENTIIREHVTMHRGCYDEPFVTRVGRNCFIMVGVHIAHDCIVGDNVIMANNATLGGHVKIGDHSTIGGLAAIHQKCRIGHHAMIGGLAGISTDVIPYGIVMSSHSYISNINVIGLKRNGYSKENIKEVHGAFRYVFYSDEGTFKERLAVATERYNGNETIESILDFATSNADREISQPRK